MKNSTITLALWAFLFCPFLLDGQSEALTILHTNDTHSQIDPFNTKALWNVGGYARRYQVIQETRKQKRPVLLLDAGDFSQGSAYFNIFRGQVEIELMNRMGYDAAALGNHEFDNGLQALADRLKRADFKVLCANYTFQNKKLAKQVRPYHIFKKGGVKIGVYGLLVNLKGLVARSVLDSVTYEDPIEVSRRWVSFLREKKRCDMVVCLSHLGVDKEKNTVVNDSLLALAVGDIDLIVGGHTHRLLEGMVVNGVPIVQLDYGGLRIGKIDIYKQKEDE